MINGVEIIAKVKIKSPFGYKSKESCDALFKIANKIGDIISIHIDARWGGSFDLINKAKRLTNKKILAKGIHHKDEDIKKAIANGADYVLVVGRIPPKYGEICLIEANSIDELAKIPNKLRAVWNQRDLNTGGRKSASFEEARKVFSGWLCQASFISSISDTA